MHYPRQTWGAAEHFADLRGLSCLHFWRGCLASLQAAHLLIPEAGKLNWGVPNMETNPKPDFHYTTISPTEPWTFVLNWNLCFRNSLTRNALRGTQRYCLPSSELLSLTEIYTFSKSTNPKRTQNYNDIFLLILYFFNTPIFLLGHGSKIAVKPVVFQQVSCVPNQK